MLGKEAGLLPARLELSAADRVVDPPLSSGVLDTRAQRILVPRHTREAIGLGLITQHDPRLIGQAPVLLRPWISRVARIAPLI